MNTCWYCDFFDLSSGVTGFCRRYAPSSTDYQSISGNLNGDGSNVFASIPDATVEWCGDFKRAINDPGAPPV